MPSYTTSLRLVQPSAGEYPGSWGDEVNNSLTALVDKAVAGSTSITMTAANYTLTNANGVADEAKSMFLVLGGTPGASYQVIVPSTSKLYFVTNSTGFAQTVKTSAGSGVSVPNGARMALRCDGTDVLAAQNYFASMTLGTALPVASGGTGATTSTGTGAVVLATSPTLVTPALGTPASGNFSSGSFTWPTFNQNTTGTASNVTGTVAVANGGTGLTSFTSGGVMYASSTSALATGSGLVFDGSNLGIGTSSPGYKLDVNGFIRARGDILSMTATSDRIQLLPQAAGSGGIIATADQTFASYTPMTFDASYHVWRPGGTERMRLDSSGNLGIGTSSPTEKLQVVGGIIQLDSTSDGNNGILRIRNSTAVTTLQFYADANDGWFGTVESKNLRFTTNNTERMRLDASGNLGLGVTPSAWGSSRTAIQIHGASLAGVSGSNTFNELSANRYINSSGQDIYISTGAATVFQQTNGAYQWYTAPSGTAGNAISFVQSMTLDASGDLGLGTSSPSDSSGFGRTLDVAGASAAGAAVYIRANASATNYLALGQDTSGNSYIINRANASMLFYTNNTERARITSAGNFVAGAQAALATTATDGFLYVPTCAGTPTGTPTAITGMAPIVVNTTNNKLYFYSGGAWRDAGP